MDELRGFTVDEVRGYLPAGWNLVEAAAADAGEDPSQDWRATLTDGADVVRELAVEAAAIERYGRFEALRRAVDRLYREALS